MKTVQKNREKALRAAAARARNALKSAKLQGWIDLRLDEVSALVDAGADPFSTREGLPSVLEESMGFPRLVARLVPEGRDLRGVELRGKPLLFAALPNELPGRLAVRDWDTFRLLVERGADVNAVGPRERRVFESLLGDVVFLRAASFRVHRIFAELVRAGLDVRAPSGRCQKTVLHLLTRQRVWTESFLEDVLLALENGADPNARDAHGRTPLHAAAAGLGKQNASADVFAALVRAGADPNARDRRGRTPFFVLVKRAAGIKVAAGNDERRFAEEEIRLALGAGADSTVEDEKGDSPLSVARRAGGWLADTVAVGALGKTGDTGLPRE